MQTQQQTQQSIMRMIDFRACGWSKTRTFHVKNYYYYDPSGKVFTCPLVGRIVKGYAPTRYYLQGVPEGARALIVVDIGGSRRDGAIQLMDEVEKDVRRFINVEWVQDGVTKEEVMTKALCVRDVLVADAVACLEKCPGRQTLYPASSTWVEADIQNVVKQDVENLWKWGVYGCYERVKVGWLSRGIKEGTLRVSGRVRMHTLWWLDWHHRRPPDVRFIDRVELFGKNISFSNPVRLLSTGTLRYTKYFLIYSPTIIEAYVENQTQSTSFKCSGVILISDRVAHDC